MNILMDVDEAQLVMKLLNGQRLVPVRNVEDEEMSITSIEYWEEIKSIAANLIEENQEEANERGDCVLEYINDSGLIWVGTVGHQWITNYSYNLDVLDNTDNFDYIEGNLGSDYLGDVLKRDGLRGLHQAMAYHAMLADVQVALRKLGK